MKANCFVTVTVRSVYNVYNIIRQYEMFLHIIDKEDAHHCSIQREKCVFYSKVFC